MWSLFVISLSIFACTWWLIIYSVSPLLIIWPILLELVVTSAIAFSIVLLLILLWRILLSSLLICLLFPIHIAILCFFIFTIVVLLNLLSIFGYMGVPLRITIFDLILNFNCLSFHFMWNLWLINICCVFSLIVGSLLIFELIIWFCVIYLIEWQLHVLSLSTVKGKSLQSSFTSFILLLRLLIFVWDFSVSSQICDNVCILLLFPSLLVKFYQFDYLLFLMVLFKSYFFSTRIKISCIWVTYY